MHVGVRRLCPRPAGLSPPRARAPPGPPGPPKRKVSLLLDHLEVGELARHLSGLEHRAFCRLSVSGTGGPGCWGGGSWVPRGAMGLGAALVGAIGRSDGCYGAAGCTDGCWEGAVGCTGGCWEGAVGCADGGCGAVRRAEGCRGVH